MAVQHRVIFFLALVFILPLIVISGCGGAQTPVPSSMQVTTPIPTHIPTAVPQAPSVSEPAREQPKVPYYDHGEPSSVTDKEALFDYLRSVTGVVVGIQFSTPPLKNLPEDFQREFMELIGNLSAEEYALVLKRSGVDSKEGLFDIPVRVFSFAPPGQAWGHGIVIVGRALTISHVVTEHVQSIKSSPLKGLPLDLISIRYTFLLLQEGLSEPPVFKLREDKTYPEYLIAWLGSAMDSEKDAFHGLGSSPFSNVMPAEWEKLQPGTFLYVVTYEGVKEALVSTLEEWPDSLNTSGSLPPESFLRIRLLHGYAFKNGDSGAPIFAIKNGRAYFVGLIEAAHRDRPFLGVVLNGRYAFLTLPY